MRGIALQVVRVLLSVLRRCIDLTARLLLKFNISVPALMAFASPLDSKLLTQYLESANAKSFSVVCDLAVVPLSFDIFMLLAVAESYRRKHNFDRFNVTFMISDADPLPVFHSKENPISEIDAKAVLLNLGMAAAQSFPACGDISVFSSRTRFKEYLRDIRKRETIFPIDYSPDSPNYHLNGEAAPLYSPIHAFNLLGDDETTLLQASPSSLERAGRWIDSVRSGRVIVSLTMRNTKNAPDRNSRSEEWQRLVDSFRDQSILFVLIEDYFAPDFNDVVTGENVIRCQAAVESIPFRSALYELADFNLLANSGSAALCYLNKNIRYAAVNIGLDARSSSAEDMATQWGVAPNGPIWGNGPFRRWVWERDDFAVLKREIDLFLQSLP